LAGASDEYCTRMLRLSILSSGVVCQVQINGIIVNWLREGLPVV
jgi:hypothetical protein